MNKLFKLSIHENATLIYFLNNKGKKRGYNDNTENEQTKPFDRIELEGI